MIKGVIVREVPLHTDPRGWLLKAVPSEFVGGHRFGEIYLSGANPGETKGCHYHEEAAEWFCVIQGAGKLRLEDTRTGEKMTVRLSRDDRISVEIPPGVAHSVSNEGDGEMILLAYSNMPYDPHDPDTVPWDLGERGCGTGR